MLGWVGIGIYYLFIFTIFSILFMYFIYLFYVNNVFTLWQLLCWIRLGWFLFIWARLDEVGLGDGSLNYVMLCCVEFNWLGWVKIS